MRHLFLRLIQLYRGLIPPERRRHCLFRESCSLYVERITEQEGVLAALRAFRQRWRCCRPGYGFEWSQEKAGWFLVCADGSKFPEAVVAPHVVGEYHLLVSSVLLAQAP